MTQFIVLTDAELDALQGESADVFKFYVCLRRRMDRSTGLVGATVGLSWQALREDMYVEPRSGRVEHGTPSVGFVRDKASRLSEIGLVESKTSYRRLVFFAAVGAPRLSPSKINGADVQQTIATGGATYRIPDAARRSGGFGTGFATDRKSGFGANIRVQSKPSLRSQRNCSTMS